MKTLYILSIVLFASANVYSQSVAINSNGAAPDPNSILDLSGSTKGLLLPRMTDAEMNALTTSKTGMLVFNTTQGVMMMQHGSDVTPSWQKSATNITTWNLIGNAGTNSTTNFLGTTDAVPLIFKTNNTERIQISTTGEIGAGTAPVTNTRLTVNNTSNNTSTSTVVKGQTTQVNLGADANADTVIMINTQFSYNNESGNIEDFIGIKVGDISGTNNSFRNSGLITNTYGVFIGDLTDPAGRTGTKTYAIYNADTAAKNYHAGKTGFGEPNPTSTIHIKGSFKFDDGSPAGDEYKVLEFDPAGNARWTKPGRLKYSTLTTGVDYAMTPDDYLVIARPTTVDINITLPLPLTKGEEIIRIFNESSSNRVNLIGGIVKGPSTLNPLQSIELIYSQQGSGKWYVLSFY